MNLNKRIEALEKQTLANKGWHPVLVFKCDRETAISNYCKENGLDPEKLENGDYGQLFIIEPIFVSAKRKENESECAS